HAGCDVGRVSGDRRQMARRALVEQRCRGPAVALGICEVPRGLRSGSCRPVRETKRRGACAGGSAVGKRHDQLEAGTVSIYLRSLLFNIGFYLSLVVHILIAIPTFVLPRRALFKVANSWVHTTNWML